MLNETFKKIILIQLLIIPLAFASYFIELFYNFFIASLSLSVFITSIIDSFFVAFVEEIAKITAVYLLVFRKSDFSNVKMGFIFSIFAGLGFAIFENIIYTFNNGFSVIGLRLFSAVPLHIVATALFGLFIGKSMLKIELMKRQVLAFKGLFLALFIHAIYNLLLIISDDSEHSMVSLIFPIIAYCIPFVIIFLLLIKVIKIR